MKLQVALDYMPLNRSLAVARAAAPYVDWIEAGTSLIKAVGVHAAGFLKQEFPDHTIVADMKTADGGRRETAMAFEAGADVSTVLGLVPDRSVVECLETGKAFGKTVYVDLLGCSRARWQELLALGAACVIYHIGKDEQGSRSLSMDVIRELKAMGFTVAVAGGITLAAVADLAAAGCDVAIIGTGITGADSPADAAKAFRAAVQKGA